MTLGRVRGELGQYLAGKVVRLVPLLVHFDTEVQLFAVDLLPSLNNLQQGYRST